MFTSGFIDNADVLGHGINLLIARIYFKMYLILLSTFFSLKEVTYKWNQI